MLRFPQKVRGLVLVVGALGLSIWGDKDSLTPLDQGRDLHGLLNGSTLLVMPEVGHIPQLEDPSAFNRLLTAALRNMVR